MVDKPSLKGVWLHHVTRFKLFLEWLKPELSSFVQRETISSVAKGMTNHP